MNLVPGQTVFVVERNSFGEAYDVSGYMFLASVLDMAIVSVYYGTSDDLEDTLEYCRRETVDNSECLYVFPLDDCFITLSEARDTLRDETDGNDSYNIDSYDESDDDEDDDEDLYDID